MLSMSVNIEQLEYDECKYSAYFSYRMSRYKQQALVLIILTLPLV